MLLALGSKLRAGRPAGDSLIYPPFFISPPFLLAFSYGSFLLFARLLSMKTSNGLAIIPKGNSSVATGSLVAVIITGPL
jgi:hypothetical protein